MRLTVAVALFSAATVFADSSILWAAPAQPEHAVATASSQAKSGDRRRIFVGVVGFAALVLGLTGLWLLRRSRARIAVSPPVGDAAPSPVVTRVARTAPPAAAVQSDGGQLACPACRAQAWPPALFCKLDGTRLVQLRDAGDAREPSGGVCPVCEQDFDPGIDACPVHDEDLVPAAEPSSAERPSGQYPKICPTCGVQYPNGSGFCGADGSALVTVN